MATRTLHVTDPAEVSSPKTLEVFIGTPPKRLLLFTGIAIPEWDSNQLLDRETVFVDLNATSNAPNPPFAATVGLASIDNTDSDLVFAADDVAVVTGPKLELLLVCNIAVLGDRSVLSRFSYQAMVFLDPDRAQIAGTIRWDPRDLTHSAAMETDLFAIEAYTLKAGPGAPGGFGTTIRTVEKVGATLGKPGWFGAQLGVPYAIDEPPLGEPLFVSVDPKPGAFVVNSTRTFNFVQVSGPNPIALSPPHPTEQPVDFEARPYLGPR